MTHITPTFPAVGDTNWGGVLNTALTGIVTKVNAQDDVLTAGGVAIVTNNGDGTLTLSGPGVVDNGDGTFTITS